MKYVISDNLDYEKKGEERKKQEEQEQLENYKRYQEYVEKESISRRMLLANGIFVFIPLRKKELKRKRQR